MSGTELKLRRVAAHAKAKDVAALAGWTSQRISQIEAAAFVAPDIAGRYIAALDQHVAERATSATVTSVDAA